MAYTLGRYCGTAGRAGSGRAEAGHGPGRAGPKIFGPCTSLVLMLLNLLIYTLLLQESAAGCTQYVYRVEMNVVAYPDFLYQLSVTARISQDYELSVFVRHLIRHKLNKALQITRHNTRLPVFYTSYSETE